MDVRWMWAVGFGVGTFLVLVLLALFAPRGGTVSVGPPPEDDPVSAAAFQPPVAMPVSVEPVRSRLGEVVCHPVEVVGQRDQSTCRVAHSAHAPLTSQALTLLADGEWLTSMRWDAGWSGGAPGGAAVVPAELEGQIAELLDATLGDLDGPWTSDTTGAGAFWDALRDVVDRGHGTFRHEFDQIGIVVEIGPRQAVLRVFGLGA